MRVGLKNIDPKIAEAIAERLAGPMREFLSEEIQWTPPKSLIPNVRDSAVPRVRKRTPTHDERFLYKLREKRNRQVRQRQWTAAILAILAGFGVSFLVSLFNMAMVGRLAGAATWLVLMAAGSWWAERASARNALNFEITLEQLEAVLPLLSLTRAERVYCDTLLMSARMEANLEARRTVRRTLGQLNELLTSSRILDQKRQNLLRVLGASPLKELEAEAATLQTRRDQATDGQTREAIERSLQLVTTRLENTRTFEQTLVRLNAQQEALVNALAMAQSAMARMQVAPSVETDQAAKEITDTVIAMNRQTYSVEQAVEEVMALRAS